MKFDIVIPFWGKEPFIPLVACGLNANQEFINEIHLIVDGPADEQVLDSFLYHLDTEPRRRLLPHFFDSHDGFGVSRCINLGLARARTEWVVSMDGDMVLNVDALAQLAAIIPHTRATLIPLGFGNVWEHATPALYPNLPTHGDDTRPTEGYARPWFNMRGGLWAVKRETFVPWPERDELPHYGHQDHIFALRYLQEHGQAALHFMPGNFGFQVCNPVEAASETRKLRSVPAENFVMMAQETAKILPPAYNLGSGDNFMPDYINVDISERTADLRLDCIDLSWIEPDTATEIVAEHFIEHIPPSRVPQFLATAFEALRPGCTLTLVWPDVLKCAQLLLDAENDQEEHYALKGLFSDPQLTEMSHFQKHAWGWSLTALLNKAIDAGFQIEYAGDEYVHAWRARRDSRLELSKPEDDE